METTTVDGSESRTGTPKFLWQRALGQADDDLRKTLLATKTNRRDVLKAVRKVVQEKRCQSLWKCWTYETAEKDVVIVRDLLEKILCLLDLIQANARLNPQGFSEDLQAGWRLTWSPFWFLLQKTAKDAQAFGELVNDLACALCLLVRYQVLEAERPSQAIEDISNSDGAILSVYHAVYDILAHYIRSDNKETGAEVDTHQLREKLFQADSNAKAAIGQTNIPTESLYLRSAAPETVHEVRIPDELGSSLHQWGIPALLEADEDNYTPDTRCELLESESFRSWWESSTSSILSLCGAVGTCQAARKLLAGSSTSAPVAYIDCSKLSSALEILQHVVASFTLANDEKCSDVLVTEWQIKQAASQQDGGTVGPLNLQDCLRITLDIAAANPMTILLDGVLDTDDEKLSDSLIEVVDKSENVVKVLLVTEHDIPLLGCERTSSPAAANFHIRNAKAQPSWKDLEATTPPSVHPLSETEQQATLHDAIKTGDIGSVVSLIHHTPRVAAQTDPKDALSTAVLHNHIDILTYLLNTLPSTSSSNDALASALLTAALINHTRCARTLLSHHGINRTATDTALRAAATRGHARTIKQLLAYYYAEDAAAATAAAAAAAAAATALPLAAQHGHSGAVHALLDVAAAAAAAAARNINATISTAVQLAVAGGHADVVGLLLDRGGGGKALKASTNIDAAISSMMAAATPPPSPRMAHESKWDSLLRCTSPGWLEMRGRRCVVNEGSEDRDDGEKKGAAAATTTQTERILATMLGSDDLSSVEKQLARGGGDVAAVAAVAAVVAGPLYARRRGRRTRGRQQLHALEVAAAAGREAVVGLFLRRREELDIQAEHVGHAFAAAAANGHVQIVRQLLPLLDGADVAGMAAASEALEGAVRNGHAETVEFLLEYGAARGRAEQDVRIVLESISSEDSATFVLKLLQLAQERDSEEKLNELRQKALCVAAEHGNVLVLDSILSSGVALENGSFAKAMYAACRPGHTAAALALINSEARKLLESDDIEDCLLVAAREGHAELAQCLLPHLNLEKATEVLTRCVEAAAGNDHLACTQVLMAALTEEEDCIRAARCAFATAAQNGHADMVRFLLERGADPEKESMTHAMKECINRFTLHSPRFPCSRVPSGDGWKKSGDVGTRATVRTLLEYGADANAKYGSGKSVLHTAVQNCPVEVVEWLIEHGADVKAAATAPNSVFVAVAGRELDSLAVMELLLRAGGQLEPSVESIHPVLAKALEFFDGNIGPYCYRGTLKDPDGRFELAESIRYVLEQGPGAMIRRTLQLLPAEKAADPRYGLLLQMAAADNDTSLAELLLARGVDVNAAGFYYGTALQAAARHDHAVMVSLLLAAGADVNVLQGRYHTPLRAAVAGGHTDIVRTLLSHGADVALSFANDTDNPRTFPLPAASTLRLAVERGHFAAAKLLLDAAATDDNATTDQQRKSPHEQPQPLLIVAAARNDVRMVELLVAAGASHVVNVRGQQMRDGGFRTDGDVSALHAACAQGHVDMVRALLRLGADVDAVVQCEKRPLQGYRVVGQPAVVQRWETKSPLATAVWWCGMRKKGAAAASVVRELVGAGADVNKPSGRPGRTPLCEAAAVGDVDVVEVLVEAGAALYVGGARDNPLGKACAYGRLDVVEYLMEKICGTDIERAACADGMRRAVEMKQRKAIELLLEFMPADQETLLSVVTAGLPSLVQRVLEAGVHVDARDQRGRTALLAAAYTGNAAVVRMLLERGANVKMKTRLGSSPMTEAFRRAVWDKPFSSELPSFEEVIRLLVESGADVEDEGPREEANGRKKMAPPRSGIRKTGSALQLAAHLRSEKTVALLLDKGAGVNRKCGSLEAPLLVAVEKDHSVIVQLLLERGADCRQVSEKQDTPLHLACKKGSTPCMRLLLRHGADPNARGADHATPLTLAIKAVRFKPPNSSEKESFLDVFLKEAPGVRVTEAGLLAAAETLDYRANLRLLLDHFVKDIPVSEAVIVTVLKKTFRDNLSEEDRSLIRDLLDHANGIGITAAMVQSTHNADTLDFLLTHCGGGQHHPVCAITPAVLEGCTDTATVYYLLQRDKRLVPTQLAALRAVCNPFSAIYGPAARAVEQQQQQQQQQRRQLLRPEISRVRLLRLLWERNPRLSVSQSMLRDARNADELTFLLAKAKENHLLQELVIDQDTVFEIVTWKGCCADKLRVLLEFRPDLRLDNATMTRLLKRVRVDLSVWAVLLKSQPQLVVTEEVFRWTRLTEEWVELMRECGKDVVFTDNMRRHVERLLRSRSQAALKELVFSLERKERDGDESAQRH